MNFSHDFLMAGNLVEDPKTEECSYFVLKPLKLLLFTVIYDPFLGSFGDDFLSSCIKYCARYCLC